MAEDGARGARGARGVAVSIDDAEYPRPLRHIFDPPDVLFVEGRGSWRAAFGGLAVGIVGARDATAQGLAMARSLGRDLAGAGVAVVSGLALGIDGAAHAGALEAGGVTVAVVGGGTNVVYPRRNRRIREEILQRGLIVSEWPPGMEPRASHFPRRNRLISGLSLGVVVVEATERSGSLITARQAAEQGREVFAVPGPAGAPRSMGPHALLREGARLVENVHDILEELSLDALEASNELEGEAHRAASLLRAIGEGALTVDEMAVTTDRSVEDIWVDLLDLEVRGRIIRGPGGRFARTGGSRT